MEPGLSPQRVEFYDDTPKGVTVHFIDSGIDTDDIIVQRELRFGPDDTLASFRHMRLGQTVGRAARQPGPRAGDRPPRTGINPPSRPKTPRRVVFMKMPGQARPEGSLSGFFMRLGGLDSHAQER